jgi:hypothetical protein
MYGTAICGHIYNSMRTICGHTYISIRTVSHWQSGGLRAPTTTYLSSYYRTCVLILLYACPHTATHCSPLTYNTKCALIMMKCVHILQHAISHWQRKGGAALIPLYRCPHTSICVLLLLHVSLYYSKCVHILQHAESHWQRGGRRKRARVRETSHAGSRFSQRYAML